MFGIFKKQVAQTHPLPKYADIFDTMLYQAPDGTPKGALPTIYAFRVKAEVKSTDRRPDFAVLETDDEIHEWQQVLAGPVSKNDDGDITDAPLLQWNNIPSLLTADDEIIATYFPVRENEGWPPLALKAHPFGTALDVKPARDRYYFEQNKVVGFL